MALNQDFKEFIQSLNDNDVKTDSRRRPVGQIANLSHVIFEPDKCERCHPKNKPIVRPIYDACHRYSVCCALEFFSPIP